MTGAMPVAASIPNGSAFRKKAAGAEKVEEGEEEEKGEEASGGDGHPSSASAAAAETDLLLLGEEGLVRYSSASGGGGSPQKGRPQRRKKASSSSSSSSYPVELGKTLAAFAMMCASFVLTTASLSVVHEFLPEYRPLPDFFLDHVSYLSWALKASEIMLQAQATFAVAVVFLHRHRTIVFRRVALILSLLYGYRAITMFVTVLPKANPAYYCSPKLVDHQERLTFLTVLWRVAKLLSGLGLTMNGTHTFCGDFIFSGHTMTLVLSVLVVQEYTSRRLWMLHWLVVVSATGGVAFLLLGRGHYSIDVIIAYWITTRLWYMAHAMSCHEQLKHATGINYFARMWWWPVWRWFEGNVRAGPLPHGFSLPVPLLPLVRKLKYFRRGNRSVDVSSTSHRNRRRLKDIP